MATERTVVKPLSGAEIVEAILSRVRSQLQRDCFLASHLAYKSYSAQVDVRVQFQDTGTRITDTEVHVQTNGGEVTDEEMQVEEAHVEVTPEPPNIVRRETGQDVPVVTPKPSGGMEERRVRYAPKGTPETTTRKALEQPTVRPAAGGKARTVQPR